MLASSSGPVWDTRSQISQQRFQLPVFLAVGPPRTGTTWLHEVLSGHINLPRHNKETRFFDARFDKGLRWYASHFDQKASRLPRGEICPTYFRSAEARRRIAQLAPEMKIICTFRDPVERIFSLYKIKRAYGAEPCSLDEAVERDPELIDSSRYAYHLSRWQTTFGGERVLTRIYDDLKNDPQTYIDQIADFIGIPRFPLDTSHIRRVNSSERIAEPRSVLWTRFAAGAADFLKAHRLGVVVGAVKKSGLANLFLGSGTEIPMLDQATAARLRSRLRSEVDALEAMIGRDLSNWRKDSACRWAGS